MKSGLFLAKGLLSLTGLVSAFLSVGCSVFGIRSEETPAYSVLLKEDVFEVREYQPIILATTEIRGSFEEAQSEGFKRLAGYIFGKNRSQTKIAMTAPVTQTSNAATSEKISMTAPVTQTLNNGVWSMAFTMPSKYKMADLPAPLDERVVLKTQPQKLYAVISYTGFWSEKKNQEKAEQLKEWIGRQSVYRVVGPSSFAGYNPPWTLPFLRKNEIWIEVLK